MIPFSILDLSPITEGSDAAQSFRNSLSLARHGEALGYTRYWLAEHHGMPGIASAATAVLLAYIGAGTSTIRIGAGARQVALMPRDLLLDQPQAAARDEVALRADRPVRQRLEHRRCALCGPGRH